MRVGFYYTPLSQGTVSVFVHLRINLCSRCYYIQLSHWSYQTAPGGLSQKPNESANDDRFNDTRTYSYPHVIIITCLTFLAFHTLLYVFDFYIACF